MNLCSAYWTTSHSYPNAVDTGLNKVISLPSRYDIPSNQIYMRVCRLDVLNNIYLVYWVALTNDHTRILSIATGRRNFSVGLVLTWEESITIRSTPASTRALQRSLSFGRVPMAAPTRSCLFLSLEASGNSTLFFISIEFNYSHSTN